MEVPEPVSSLELRTPAPVSQTDLRRVLGSFATGVVVVTGEDNQGPVGLVCQSFASVSLDPPLVLVCPAHTSTSWPRIARIGRFVVNVLAADQREVCRRFSVSGGDKFADLDWSRTEWGPSLAGSLAQVMCTVQDVHRAGDHDIVVGHVRQLVSPREHGPLLYFRGGFGLSPC